MPGLLVAKVILDLLVVLEQMVLKALEVIAEVSVVEDLQVARVQDLQVV